MEKIFKQRPLHHYIIDPSPLVLEKLQVIRVRVMEKMLCLPQAAATISIIVGTAAPHQCLPHQATIYFRCIFRDAPVF